MDRWLLTCCTAVTAIALSLATVGCGVFDDETYRPPEGPGPWILVDLYHSRKQNHEDYRLTKGDYNYQGIFGFYRAFEHLQDHDYKVRTIRSMPLSGPRLAGFDVLFINLVDTHLPDFSADELRAIDQWVQAGGGLFVIADHTNVYRNAERLNPLLEPMGIEVGYHTAVDYPPEHSVAGLGWLLVRDFAPHYVTRGVDVISPQTGAPLFGDYGVAWTSDDSFADLWDESDGSGFYGNWQFDGDPTREPRGPLPVVAAREYGQGRVVVAGDQNMFGDAWLYFGDNFGLLMNTFQWLAGQEDAAPLRAAKPAGFNIGLDMAHDNFEVGRSDADGYYPFYVNLNRDHQVTANARVGVGRDDDALMLMDPTIPFDPAAIARIERYFARGKTVVVSFEADDISAATVDLLTEIAPAFSLSVAGVQYGVADTDPADFAELDIAHRPGAHQVRSSQLEVAGLEISTIGDHPDANDQALSPYLLAVTSKWGDPFIRAQQGGETVDIARRKPVGDGQLVVLIQDGFWRNRTLGYSETTAPTDQNADAIALEYRLVDYLKQSRR